MDSYKLINGVMMPAIGYGVYQIEPELCEKCVAEAIDVGYRMIDTARYYGNEEAVGRAVGNSSVARQDMFLTTKLWFTDYGESKAADAISESLERLQTEYIDLLLLHQPLSDYYGAWRAMERAYYDGKVKAIGVSNFSASELIDLSSFARVVPMVNQIEMHVFNQQQTIRTVAERYSCRIVAWGPLARGRNGFFDNPMLSSISRKYGKTVSQIALRFLVQSGVAVIPKTTHIDRMKENLDVTDFELSHSDMDEIRNLDMNETLFFDLSRPQDMEAMIRRQ